MIYIYRYTCYITKHLHGVVAGGGIELLVDHAEVGPLQLLRHLGLRGYYCYYYYYYYYHYYYYYYYLSTKFVKGARALIFYYYYYYIVYYYSYY